MYINWIQGKEEDKLFEHYEQNINAYMEAIDNIVSAQKFARKMKKNIKKRISNCKILSQRVLTFSVK